MVVSIDVDDKIRQSTALNLKANLRWCRCSVMVHMPNHIDETHIQSLDLLTEHL